MRIQGQISLYNRKSQEAGLAELLMALKILKPERDETRILIANKLGLVWKGPESIAKGNLESSQSPTNLEEKMMNVTSELKVPMQLHDSGIAEDSPGEILERERHVEEVSEFLLHNNNPLSLEVTPLEPTNIESHKGRPEFNPLIHDRWFHGLMGIMLATSRTSQDIDWAMIERKLVRGQPLDRLPLQQELTLNRGVSLFLDRSESMQPFWRDEKELLNKLQQFLGQSKVQTWRLEIDHWQLDEAGLIWYSSPPINFPENKPLLLVSDFGIRGKASGRPILKPWLPYLALARKNHCPIIALIPAPESYWPSALKSFITFPIVWDRNTSISTVRRYRHHIH